MISDQVILFGLLGVVFILLIWGKIRYDLVAFGALTIAIVIGVVPQEEAFAGFGHHATIIIALVLIVSRGLFNSGAIELVARHVIDSGRSLFVHIGVMSGVAAVLSAVMNNVAALALLMPLDIQAAKKAKRSVSLSLMPLSFASILGGMITLIGTPPNIIIASFREQAVGEPFGMFDFAPVGAVTALVGVIFIVVIGWRLIPVASREDSGDDKAQPHEDYVAEVLVGENSSMVGLRVRDLDQESDEADVAIIGLVRNGNRLPGGARAEAIRAGDLIVIEANAEHIDAFVGSFKLEYVGSEKYVSQTSKGLSLVEAVVPENARIEGRSALSLQLLYRHGVTLLGVSRKGKNFRQRVRKLDTRAGDVLLLLGPAEHLDDVVAWLGCLPLQQRELQLVQRHKAWVAVGSFALAIAATTSGVIHLPEALALVCMVMVGFNIVPLKELYSSVEWPIIILLGSMIPIGAALESAGGTALIAQHIIEFAADYGPVVVLTLLMIVTMTLSDILNNTATTIIAAPIAIDIAGRLGVNPDPFLMAVAVAASCAFLTPIGHKNNILILGPGGYRFGDYWQMGLPLEIIVVVVSIPMILLVWPF
jgi:di/tricarboxylate transporter